MAKNKELERQKAKKRAKRLRKKRGGDAIVGSMRVGDRRVPIDEMTREVLELQFEQFRKKFGREPQGSDPIFFDPDSDSTTPQPFNEEKYKEQVAEVMEKVGTPSEIVYAYRKTGMMVTAENVDKWTDADIDEWEEAVAEGRRAVS